MQSQDKNHQQDLHIPHSFQSHQNEQGILVEFPLSHSKHTYNHKEIIIIQIALTSTKDCC